MKLSPLQTETIKEMRKGKVMWKNAASVVLVLSRADPTQATFFALARMNIIQRFGKHKSGWGFEYRLTERGKSIKL